MTWLSNPRGLLQLRRTCAVTSPSNTPEVKGRTPAGPKQTEPPRVGVAALGRETEPRHHTGGPADPEPATKPAPVRPSTPTSPRTAVGYVRRSPTGNPTTGGTSPPALRTGS
jgi:hypothetical protein